MNISEGFGELGITITKHQIIQMEKLAVTFPLYKTHPLTFQHQMLAVDPVSFKTPDYNALFDVFNVHIADVRQVIGQIESINKSFNVISDPFNLLCVWLCHLAPIYIKDHRVAERFMRHVMLYFHYKIFCSTVNNSWRHGANRGVMEATVASLSKKSDIIRLGSWQALIDSHVDRILNPKEHSYAAIVEGGPDADFLRVISDAQTALRSKIITFAVAYYEAHGKGEELGTVSAIATNSDGEKIIAQTASVIDSATSSMVSDILNPHTFVHEASVADIARGYSTISERFLKTALLRINAEAALQVSQRTFDKVKVDKEGTLYIGIRALTMEIIRVMVRITRTRGINPGNRAKVFDEMRKAITSSRNLDPDIADIKRSVAHLVDPFGITINPASASSLRLAVVLYIVYRTILKMKV